MEIKSANISNSNTVQTKNTTQETGESQIKFSDELQELEKNKETQQNDDCLQNNDMQDEKPANKTLNPLINQSEEKTPEILKKQPLPDDKNIVINNDFNIQPDKDKLPLMDMNMNMNFSEDGQSFAAFINKTEKSPDEILKSTATELAEEAAILSTMSENLAMANKNRIETVSNEEGIEKVDSKTGIKVETVIKYDSIIMNQADVEVFTNLVENKEVDMNNLAPQALEKSVKVSKTLADMLVKAKENNQPLRINFDNNISVIIRISKDGKISADFLPSSQIAEAYLKENLPLLKQRFDDNNISYGELNQRENRNKNKDNNRKEGRKNE